MASSASTTSSAANGGDQLEALPKGCTFTKLTKPVDGAPSACYSDHWCHANHNWCKAHNTMGRGAPDGAHLRWGCRWPRCTALDCDCMIRISDLPQV
jgi:hypothetical protein